MAQVSIKLLTNKKADSDNKYPLAIRIYHKKYIYFYFPFRLAEDQWSETVSRVRQSHHNYDLLNDIIEKKYISIDGAVVRILSNRRNISAKMLKTKIKDEISETSTDFISYYKDYVDGLLPEYSHSYHQLHNCVCNHFSNYFNGSLSFDDIDLQALRKFKTHLLQEGISPNSVARYLGQANVVYKHAIKEGAIPQDKNPFELVDYPSEQVHKTYLPLKQIQALEATSFEPRTLRWKVKLSFLFSFWTAGMRCSDICLLRWSNIKDLSDTTPTLDYVMKKNGKHVEMSILPPAKKILQKLKPDMPTIGMDSMRVFGFIPDRDLSKEEEFKALHRTNSKINRSLKNVVAKRAGINEDITFHIARHSFAACFEELDMPIQFMQSLLAHSSSKTTEKYRKSFTAKQNKKAMGAFWDEVKKASKAQ